MLLDIVFLVSIVYGIFMGFSSGFFGSVLKMFRYFLAFILSMKSSYLLMDYLHYNTGIETAHLPLFAFILMYILVMGVMTAVNSVLGTLKMGDSGNTLWNRGIGLLAWSFMLSTLFSAFIAFGEQTGFISPKLLASSAVYPYVVDIYPVLKCKLAYLIPAVGDILDSFQNIFSDLARRLRGDCCY